MLSNRKWLGMLGGGAIVAMSCVPALSLVGAPTAAVTPPAAAAVGELPPRSAERAAVEFVNAMAREDAAAVWMFATEEEHDAFQTESEAFAAYSEEFPALIGARSATAQHTWQEGDTPFVALEVVDGRGERHRATLGFWLDDAGDWKLVSADLKTLSDRVASR